MLKYLDVITIDATLIVGIMIFLTFQGGIVVSTQDRGSELFLERQELTSYLLTCMPELSEFYYEEYSELTLDGSVLVDYTDPNFKLQHNSICNEMKLKLFENGVNMKVANDISDMNPKLSTMIWRDMGEFFNDYDLANNVLGFLYVFFNPNFWGLLIVIPFVLSAVYEVRNFSTRKTENNESASRFGMLSMQIGFILIIPGMIFISQLIPF